MRPAPSRKSSQATLTRDPDTHAVGTVTSRNVPPGRCGQPSVLGSAALAMVTPVAAGVVAAKLSPPSVDTSILTVLPAIQTTYTVPSAATLISGANESLASELPTACPAVPVQVAPWSFVRAKRIVLTSSQTA